MINLIKHGKTIKEYEDLKEFSLLMRKCMKYLRKFNITVNKLAYKYSKTSWINMLFQDNILDLLYYTEDFYLFFEIINTLTLFVKEEGVSPHLFKPNSKIKEKLLRIFSFFLKKEKEKVNKFYYFLEKTPEFQSIKTKIDENYLKVKPELSDYSMDFNEFVNEDIKTLENPEIHSKTPINLNNLSEKSAEISCFITISQYFGSNFEALELKPDIANIYILLKLKIFQKNEPNAYPILLTLITLQLYHLLTKWNDMMKDNKIEFFSNNSYRDAFLLFQMNSIEFLRNSKVLMKFHLESMANFPSSSSGKISEIYGNNIHGLGDFLDFYLENWFFNLKKIEKIEKYDSYLIPVLKRLKFITANEIMNMNVLKSKALFDDFFKQEFISIYNDNCDLMDPLQRKRISNMNVFLEYLTSHIMTEDTPISQGYLIEIEKFYKRILSVFLEKREKFFIFNENSGALYQAILGMVIFAFNHSKASFFEELLFQFKIITRFEESLKGELEEKYLHFSHTILNNSLLNIFKKINVNEFIADMNNQETQSFMSLFHRLTIEENLVVYRGVYVNYGSIIAKNVFGVFTNLDKIKEIPSIFNKLELFIDIYLKDFVLWTLNGYNEYPSFPAYVRPLFKEKFIDFLRNLKKIAEKDQKNLYIIYEKINNYKTIESISPYYITYLQYISYKYREILIAINRMREHLVVDVENDLFYTEADLQVFIDINQLLQTPFSYNTSKLIIVNYVKEFYYMKNIENPVKTSQLTLFLENLTNSLPCLKENLCKFFDIYSKYFPFIKIFNSDRNLYKSSNSCEIFLDYYRANHILGFLINSKDFMQFSKILTEINKSENLLGFYENALKGFIHIENNEENDIYKLFEQNFPIFFELYLYLIEKMSNEIAVFLKKNYEKLLKKYEENQHIPENLEKIKQKYAGFIGFIQAKILGKKYSRKIFKKIDLFNYLSSFMKHIHLWSKNKASKNIKNKINDLILFYFTQAKKKFMEKMKQEKDANEDFLWYFMKISFIFSELYRLNGHLSGISENYKVSSFMSENSDLFQVLAELFEKILFLLKKQEISYKWDTELEKKTEIRYFQDYFSYAFCKYFHCNLFNEYLFPSLQTEMLNIKENITMDSRKYEEKIEDIFKFIKKYSNIWVLLNKNEETMPDSLQKNYERYYTKDPLKVTNYITYGNKVIEFFLFLIYESKIRIKSNHLFLIIHTKLRAIPNAHKEKQLYVAYFARILEKHFKQIYPQWELASSKKLLQTIFENQEKLENTLNFEPKLDDMDAIYGICLQALLINLIARLIQNTNDKDPNIPKGIELIFDTWDSKFEYVKYVNKAFTFILTNKINADDHYAVFEETVYRGKDFICYMGNNLSGISPDRIIETLELFIKFITYYLKIPISKEKFGASFLRLFNENKLDLSPILLALGVLSNMKKEIFMNGIEHIIGFLQELLTLEYGNIENIKDFYNLQGIYVFTIIERLLWITGDDIFQRNLIENLISNVFYDKNKKNVKISMNFEEFSHLATNTFNNYGEKAWEIAFEICEFKVIGNENMVFLKKNIENNEKYRIQPLQEKIISMLLESFIQSSIEYLQNVENTSNLPKEIRKEAKKTQRYMLINHYFLLQIITRILKKIPNLLPFILNFKVFSRFFENSIGKSILNEFKEIYENTLEINFFDFLLMIYPYLNNAIFGIFHTIFTESILHFPSTKEKNTLISLNSLIKNEILLRVLKKLIHISSKNNIFSENSLIIHLYYTISLIILIFNASEAEDIDLNIYKKTLNACFNILKQANKKEDYTLLNNMSVFFALIYMSLKNINKKQFKLSVKEEKFDKEAIK